MVSRAVLLVAGYEAEQIVSCPGNDKNENCPCDKGQNSKCHLGQDFKFTEAEVKYAKYLINKENLT